MIYCSSSFKGPFDGKWFDWLMENISGLKDAEHTVLFNKDFLYIGKGIQTMTESQLLKYIEVAGRLMLHQLEHSATAVGNNIRDSFFTPSWVHCISSHQSYSQQHAQVYLSYLELYFKRLAKNINLEQTDVLGVCYSNYAFGMAGFQLYREKPDALLSVAKMMLDSIFDVLLTIQQQHGENAEASLSRMQDKRLKGLFEHIENALGLCLGLHNLKEVPSHSISKLLKDARERAIKDLTSPFVFEPMLHFIDDALNKLIDLEHQDKMCCIAKDWPPKKMPKSTPSKLTMSRQQHLDEYSNIFYEYSKLDLDAIFNLNDLLHLEKLFSLGDLTDCELKYVIGDWKLVPHKAVSEILNEFIVLNLVSDDYKVNTLIELIDSGFYENSMMFSLGRINISQSVFDMLVDNLKFNEASKNKVSFVKFLAMHMDRLPPTQQEKLERWHHLYLAVLISARSSEDNKLSNALDYFLSATSKRLISDHYYPTLLNGKHVSPSLIAGALAFVISSIDHVDLMMIRNVGIAETLLSSSFFSERLAQNVAVNEMYLAELLMERADLVRQNSEPTIKPNTRNFI
ncbi:hypothetical protein [Aeromonas hydrophila]|uniref:hypothetical protein n=1 Tax=Aeromonas hydrophila TaxID=644 RepID=UPI002B48B5DC|nr:hypothetical protein [Aeromonas hydrophila]